MARHFSFASGWATSYPETTGYIVPTLIREGVADDKPALLWRARQMIDWLLSIQFDEGGFQGGVIGEEPRVPVTFNTGQILLGLAAGARFFGDHRYLDSMRRAADWLVASQDLDGCWRRFPSPFAAPGEKVYETHVAWALFEADRVDPSRGYGEAGLRQVQWALAHQHQNGWFEKCCLENPSRPLTHTIGYVLRGLLECYLWRKTDSVLEASERTANALLRCVDEQGRIPGRLTDKWKAGAQYVCLTGNAQIANCWLLLYEATREPKYLAAARLANAFVRRTIPLSLNPEVNGGVRGSFPISAEYGPYEFLNWAAKFMIDSNRKEVELVG